MNSFTRLREAIVAYDASEAKTESWEGFEFDLEEKAEAVLAAARALIASHEFQRAELEQAAREAMGEDAFAPVLVIRGSDERPRWAGYEDGTHDMCFPAVGENWKP